MTGRLLTITLALLSLTLVGRSPASPAQAQSYTFQNLGALGGTTSDAYSINDFGQVVGSSETGAVGALSNVAHAYLWDHGKLTDLGTLGGDYSFGYAINDRGQVIGAAEPPEPPGTVVLRATLWNSGKVTDLGTLGGVGGVAFGINDKGQVVGTSLTRTSAYHAFLWDNGKMTDLGTLGGAQSLAFGINNRGQVVGSSYILQDKAVHAFLWEDGKMTDLSTLGGATSIAHAINSLGQVVGESYTDGNAANHAFLWDHGKMMDLGTLGGSGSIAYAINNLSQVTGEALDPLQNIHAFSWDRARGMGDLNSQVSPGTGWELLRGYGISDAGEIAGQGSFKLDLLPYLLSPVTGTSLTNDEANKASGAIDLIRQDVMQADASSGVGAFGPLTYPLSAAEARLASGNLTAAANLLQAFINQVGVLTDGTAGGTPLAPADAQRWIDQAQAILAQLRP